MTKRKTKKREIVEEDTEDSFINDNSELSYIESSDSYSENYSSDSEEIVVKHKQTKKKIQKKEKEKTGLSLPGL